MAITSGMSRVYSLLNIRFKSLPQRLVLKFPTVTPSGFAIGITLKMICFLN